MLLHFVPLALAFTSHSIAALVASPCKQYPAVVSSLSACSTASKFCSKYLGGPASFTKTVSTTRTVPRSTHTITTTTTKQTSVYTGTITQQAPTSTAFVTKTITVTTTAASCPNTPKIKARDVNAVLNRRAAAQSCGIAPNTPAKNIDGACNCYNALTATATSLITPVPTTIRTTKVVSSTVKLVSTVFTTPVTTSTVTSVQTACFTQAPVQCSSGYPTFKIQYSGSNTVFDGNFSTTRSQTDYGVTQEYVLYGTDLSTADVYTIDASTGIVYDSYGGTMRLSYRDYDGTSGFGSVYFERSDGQEPYLLCNTDQGHLVCTKDGHTGDFLNDQNHLSWGHFDGRAPIVALTPLEGGCTDNLPGGAAPGPPTGHCYPTFKVQYFDSGSAYDGMYATAVTQNDYGQSLDIVGAGSDIDQAILFFLNDYSGMVSNLNGEYFRASEGGYDGTSNGNVGSAWFTPSSGDAPLLCSVSTGSFVCTENGYQGFFYNNCVQGGDLVFGNTGNDPRCNSNAFTMAVVDQGCA